ncbi:MAG: glycoside hydrolase family 27 protein [Prevotella sp.]|nr:glycoside hydrolase family 27 protein [Prevotella sp.]
MKKRLFFLLMTFVALAGQAQTSETELKLACADIVFSQPGVRFMHKIRATNPDAKVAVEGLPRGLSWNQKRSLVEGIVEQEGEYHYTVKLTLDGKTTLETVTLTVSSTLQQPLPFMGWLSWNVVEGDISEEVVKTVADAMVSSGLAAAGYNYLCIDDLWHAAEREAGTDKPLYDAEKFPNGMKAVSDYVHSKGLKFGIYSDAGTKTCAGCFGSVGYEEIDAQQYAEWEVDLLKYDYCNAPTDVETCRERYKAMGDALKNTGREILFYMCEWGAREPWKWGAETGATCWRCTYDTRDGWNGINGGIGILQSIEGMKDIWAYSGVNRFNDADMLCIGIHGKGKSSNHLVVGEPGMTQTEYRTQFSLWCMWSSPLSLSFDLRKPISDDDLAMMTNSELIALDQDPMGQQAEFIGETDGIQIYAKDLENGDVAIAVLNLNDTERVATINFSDIPALDAGGKYRFRDLWAKEDLGSFSDRYSVSVASHETKVYRLKSVKN